MIINRSPVCNKGHIKIFYRYKDGTSFKIKYMHVILQPRQNFRDLIPSLFGHSIRSSVYGLGVSGPECPPAVKLLIIIIIIKTP